MSANVEVINQKLGTMVQQAFPGYQDIFHQRYQGNRSMEEIGVSIGRSLQTVRNRIIEIWSFIQSENPPLLLEIGSLDKEDARARFLMRDSMNYTTLKFGQTAVSPAGKVLSLNVGKRANVNMMSDIKEAVAQHREQAPMDQLAAAFKACGEKGAIASMRFGLYREEPRTLDDVGNKFRLTRERVRQISVTTAQMIYIAEQEVGAGAISHLCATIMAACPSGSRQVAPLKDLLKAAGLEKLNDHGAAHILSAIGMENIMMRGQPFAHDPELKVESAIVIQRTQQAVERSKQKKQMRQIMLVCESTVMQQLVDAIQAYESTHHTKVSRGDFISQHMTEDLLMGVNIVPTNWKSMHTDWISSSPRLTTDAYDLLTKIAAARGVTKTDLLAAAVRAISD